MEKPEQVLENVRELSRTAWLAGLVGAAFERGLFAHLDGTRSCDEIAGLAHIPPDTARAMLDVLTALGFVTREGDRHRAAAGVTALALRRMPAAQLHSTLGQVHALVRAAETDTLVEGWIQDTDVIRAQGELSELVSMSVAPMFRTVPDWHERLAAPGACFLDVGAGAAGFCVAMCRIFPHLQVVGLEPFPAALAEGQKVVAGAGLGERITLRGEGIEQLDEPDRYQGAYLAQMFFPEGVLREGFGRVLKSLRPGGWIMTGSIYDSGDGLAAALSRFQAALWGGGTRSADDVAALLGEAGFVDVMQPKVPGNLRPILARKRAQAQ
jgi:hypothetical protein